LRAHPAARWRDRWAAQPGSFYGMLLAHAGVAVFIAGVTVVGGFQSESDVRLETGQSVQAGGYTFRLDAVQPVQGPNYMAAQAVLQVSQDGVPVATLRPERRLYTVTQSAMTEVAIDRGLLRDLYVALGAPVSATAWGLRVHHKPLVNWIWGGCLLMALGGLLAVADRVRQGRRATRARTAAHEEATPVRIGPAAWAAGGPAA
jgi:cytochrome c-type biogenesis protein CcmF